MRGAVARLKNHEWSPGGWVEWKEMGKVKCRNSWKIRYRLKKRHRRQRRWEERVCRGYIYCGSIEYIFNKLYWDLHY